MMYEEQTSEKLENVMMETIELESERLQRSVRVDIYQHDPAITAGECSLLLVNDGQDLVTMNFSELFTSVYRQKSLRPVIVAAIHAGEHREDEYGMSSGPDFKGHGSKAMFYEGFVTFELLPFLKHRFNTFQFTDIAFAGFSLGALSALDIVWNNPELFSRAGVFSASLWWRSVDKGEKNYDAWKHRMMHRLISQSPVREGMKFFFACGEHDEEEDRNKNGVIDSIDDTIDLMRLLVQKGYREGRDFIYLQMPEGRHDVMSWAKAFPRFLEWAYRRPLINVKNA